MALSAISSTDSSSEVDSAWLRTSVFRSSRRTRQSPFQAASHVDESPARPAGHALGHQAAEGREQVEDLVEHAQGIAQADRVRPAAATSRSRSSWLTIRQVSAEMRSRTSDAVR